MNIRLNIGYYLIAMSMSSAMLTIAMELEKQKPTEYDLAIHLLKNTPPERIPNLILKKFPSPVRNMMFAKLIPDYSLCRQAAQLKKINSNCLLLIGHHVETEARDHERKLSFDALEPSDIPTLCPWIARIDNNAWKPRTLTLC